MNMKESSQVSVMQNANNISHCTSNIFTYFMYSFQLVSLLSVLFHKMLFFMIQNYLQVSSYLTFYLGIVAGR